MPLVFSRFPYPAVKNLVDQMTKTDALRVSLQNEQAARALRECGKEVSLFDLNKTELDKLSKWDKIEFFLLDIVRRGKLPKWPVKPYVNFSKTIVISLEIRRKSFYPCMEIDCLQNIDQYEGIRRNLKIGDKIVPAVVTPGGDWDQRIITFFEDKLDALFWILQYFRENFKLSYIYSLVIQHGEIPDCSKNLRKLVQYCSGIVVREASVYGSMSEEDYTFVLENLSVKKLLELYTETSKKFKFRGKINAKSISIFDGHWFKIGNLLNGKDYEEIEVSGSKITEKELRSFLREWTKGKFPNLKNLEIETNMDYAFNAYGFEERRRLVIPGIVERTSCIAIQGHGQYYANIYESGDPCVFEMEVGQVAERSGNN